MSSEFDNLHSTLANLAEQLVPFRVELMDRNGFKKFTDNLHNKITWEEICVSGYFSETIRQELEEIGKIRKVRLITPQFPLNNKRDQRNLEALRKLSKVKSERDNAGVEIRVNNRLHARMFVAHTTKRFNIDNRIKEVVRGLLVIGSFDFNSECMGKERYDAGITTQHPDLVISALKLFNEIWNDSSTIPLEKAYRKK